MSETICSSALWCPCTISSFVRTPFAVLLAQLLFLSALHGNDFGLPTPAAHALSLSPVPFPPPAGANSGKANYNNPTPAAAAAVADASAAISTRGTSFVIAKPRDQITTEKKLAGVRSAAGRRLGKLRRRIFHGRRRRHNRRDELASTTTFRFQYRYNVLRCPTNATTTIHGDLRGDDDVAVDEKKEKWAVLLIPPIGVGIGRWYYDRLLRALSSEERLRGKWCQGRGRGAIHSFVAPDLLGSGSAARPTVWHTDVGAGAGAGVGYVNVTNVSEGVVPSGSDLDDDTLQTRSKAKNATSLPLFTVDDWSDQLVSLMREYEAEIVSHGQEGEEEDEAEDGIGAGRLRRIGRPLNWIVVSNGGCVPIALEIGRRSVRGSKNSSMCDLRGVDAGGDHGSRNADADAGGTGTAVEVSGLVLSAPPSLSALLREAPEGSKVARSYRTLCGVAGRLFWWYALRGDGAFVQRFSERNLAASPDNLGDEWTPRCVETAREDGGMSRYSTFAFLAGALQGGSRGRLDDLGRAAVPIGVITGGDRRQNLARSWFWERRQASSNSSGIAEQTTSQPTIAAAPSRTNENSTTLAEFLHNNGNRGAEIVVGGRRCPAHEDASGFAKALLDLVSATVN